MKVWVLILLIACCGCRQRDTRVDTQKADFVETSEQIVERHRRESSWQVMNNPLAPLQPSEEEEYQYQYLRDHGWVLRFGTGSPANAVGCLRFLGDVRWYNPAGYPDPRGADRMKQRALREYSEVKG